jgi:hypothetical protein
MNLHLYKKKKVCPTIVNNIELTDEIKKYILKNQAYKIPEVTPEVKEVKPEVKEVKPEVKEVKPEITPEVKAEVKPEVKEVTPEITPEVKPEVKPKVKEVKPEVKSKVKEVKPEVKEVTPEIKEVTPEVKEVKTEVKPKIKTEVKEVKTEVKTEVVEINYDELYMQLMMLLKLALKSLKNTVFDPYEMYLIHFMENENFDQKIRDYYKFIATFGLNPIVKNKSDNFIQYYRFYRDKEHLDLAEKTFNLSEKYMNLYTSEKSKLIHIERQLLTKKVMEIIFIKKEIENYEQIGKLFNMDEEFIKINA